MSGETAWLAFCVFWIVVLLLMAIAAFRSIMERASWGIGYVRQVILFLVFTTGLAAWVANFLVAYRSWAL